MKTEFEPLSKEVAGEQSGEPILGTADVIMIYRERLAGANIPPEEIERKCEAVEELLGERGVPGSRARKQCSINALSALR